MQLSFNPFGEASGEILLDHVNCRGNETFLADCQHAEWGEHDCGHHEDVAVKCVNNDLAVTGNQKYSQDFKSNQIKSNLLNNKGLKATYRLLKQ